MSLNQADTFRSRVSRHVALHPEDIGWCDWGATAPAFRGEGVQRALERHRLGVADRLALARVHTCTGDLMIGSIFIATSLRCGFEESILRRNGKTDCPAGSLSR